MTRIFMAITLLTLLACEAGELGTGVANPPSTTSTSKAAAAISAIFTTEDENASVSRALGGKIRVQLVRWQTDNDDYGQEGDYPQQGYDCGEDDPECTCAEVLGEFENTGGPENILMGAFDDPGFYGSVDYGVTLAATDFCALPDGTENTGLGADGRGRFATFELTDDVMGVCHNDEDTEFAMASGSTGVWRNIGETADEPAYQPQIHGSFVFEFSGESIAVDCTMHLGEAENILFADCTDENGESITQDTDETCEIDTE